jgi:trans-aconitate methyltransferase
MDPGSRACLRCARSSGLSSRRGLLSDTRPPVRRVDIWESEYLHVLEGDNPVFDWTKGTALRPYLDVLDESDRGALLATYATRISPPTKSNRMVVPCCPSAASFSSHSCELEGSN